MTVRGMCDLSPRLYSPIRAGCFGSRLGLLVTGAVDDPISVPSSTSRCHSQRVIPLDLVDVPSFGFSDDRYNPSPFAGINIHNETPTCRVENDTAGSTRCVEIVTPPGNHEGGCDAESVATEGVTFPPPVDKHSACSPFSCNTMIHTNNSCGTPLPCTPAKKPKLMRCMHGDFTTNRRASFEAHLQGIGARVVTDMPCAMNDVSLCPPHDVCVSKVGFPVLPRRRSYRHKVLLRLRKKQESNNYDLALFLLVKFGGPDTVAGRSVIKDQALLECSALGRCLDKSGIDALYVRERAVLMNQLSQRIAVHTLSTSQLHRKLAKLLPPNKWFNHQKLHQKVIAQEKWNPFSIFGSALPYVNLTEVFNNMDCVKGVIKGHESGGDSAGLKAPDIAKDVRSADSGPSKDDKDRAVRDNGTRGTNETPGINWCGDPLVLDEILWYLEATDKYIDKSKHVCVLHRCFCVTPNPHIAFNWNDSRNSAWKDYRGPRASMGQALSPSMYKESMLDYVRLQDELQSVFEDKCVASSGCLGRRLSTAESECAPLVPSFCAHQLNVANDGRCSNYSSRKMCGSASGVSAAATLTPKKRRAKMQHLIYYQNYFKANRIASDVP